MFDNIISKDPTPGLKDRLKLEGNTLLIPNWITETNEADGYYRVPKYGTKKFYKNFNLNNKILYDILVLGLTSIDDRPKCPICGNECKFRRNLLGKYSGYSSHCSGKCHYKVIKPKLLSDEAKQKSLKARKESGAYDHLKTNPPGKGRKVSEEQKQKQREKMLGRKVPPEQLIRMSNYMSQYYKDNPDKLEKLINSSRGKSKRGSLQINKSVTKVFKFLSSWEEKVVSFLDRSVDDVVGIEAPEAIQYQFNGTLHYYYADIDITLSNGKHLLIEIKPTAHLYHKKNMAKFKAAQEYILSNKDIYQDYLILTENIIFIEPRKQDEIDEYYIKYLISSYIN